MPALIAATMVQGPRAQWALVLHEPTGRRGTGPVPDCASVSLSVKWEEGLKPNACFAFLRKTPE